MRDRIIRGHVRKTVVVTLKTGEGFHGVLFDADRDALVLRNTVQVEVNGSDRIHKAVDGELVVLRADVSYMQYP